MRITQLLFLGLLATSLPVQFAIADAGGERAALARINHELQAIEPLITEAASQANPDARIQFQYDWLRQDLDRIRLGIQTHIDAPRAEPRSFPPLRGDYRR
jgi:RAQPRD family integrative conjugative element protein